MQLTRSLIAIALGAALFTTGCSRQNDDVLMSELRNENARLTAELNGLQQTARDLETERNFVQEENVRLRAQLDSVATQIERETSNQAPILVLAFRSTPPRVALLGSSSFLYQRFCNRYFGRPGHLGKVG